MIISASHISYINDALTEFALEKYFGAVIAAEDFAAGSKIERAKAYMERNMIPENDRLVIGDTLHDYEMSKSLGGKCILLTSGHEGRDKLSSTDALVLDSLSIEDILSL
jgi:phosphoglycolate phosphatase